MTQDPFAAFDREILEFLETAGISPDLVQLITPPQREFGERATNVAMRLAKERRQAPRQIAADIAASFQPERYRLLAAVEPAGTGFINFRLNYTAFIPDLIAAIQQAGPSFGRKPDTVPQHVVVEHTSVNPNKEWHVGHARNAVLGDVLMRILALRGDEVEVQNYIDDTGLQAAQAIVGLQDFPEPQLPHEKYDHYVGRLYVKVAAEIGAEPELRKRLEALEAQAAAGPLDGEQAIQLESVQARLENLDRLKARVMQTMRALEAGEYRPVIERILNGQRETAARLSIFYNLLVWESDLVESHLFEAAMKRLMQSPAASRPHEGRYAGTVVIRTGEVQPGEPKYEVLIRSNGIPTYVAKDIAYHMWKFNLLPNRLHYTLYAVQRDGEELWSTALRGEERPVEPLDRLINVIGVHQSLAQATVKEALRVAGFPEDAEKLVHLAYGMVRTKEGAISGRKGTAVAADTVIDQAVQAAYDRIQEKRSADLSDEEMASTAEALGVGAIRYFMVQYNPTREIVFDVADVVSFDGNTALYIQYALVRMFAILRRATQEHGVNPEEIGDANTDLLTHEQERRLVYHLAQYPTLIADAARTLAANLVAEYAYELATIFSQFYRDCAVLSAEPALRNARLLLVQTVRDVLMNVCGVLGVPVIERL